MDGALHILLVVESTAVHRYERSLHVNTQDPRPLGDRSLARRVEWKQLLIHGWT